MFRLKWINIIFVFSFIPLASSFVPSKERLSTKLSQHEILTPSNWIVSHGHRRKNRVSNRGYNECHMRLSKLLNLEKDKLSACDNIEATHTVPYMNAASKAEDLLCNIDFLILSLNTSNQNDDRIGIKNNSIIMQDQLVDEILSHIETEHTIDSKSCSLASELDSTLDDQSDSFSLDYDILSTNQTTVYDENLSLSSSKASSYPIGIQTTGTPLLNKTSIQTIIEAAERHWTQQADLQSSTQSRFTFQRVGNSEAHVADLGEDVQAIMKDMLTQRIYPILRRVFSENNELKNEDKNILPTPLRSTSEESTLSVYDALIIRYDADVALQSQQQQKSQREKKILGAGQPLHRDLGLISVNIALNSDENFKGGGTFFEHQLLPLLSSVEKNYEASANLTSVSPLKPVGPGHALIHPCNERHAGAATHGGVRDILVLFITERYHNDENVNVNEMTSSRNTPPLEFNARLKSKAMSITNTKTFEEHILQRVMHHRLAIEMNPGDGEAWQYLANSLRDLCSFVKNQLFSPEEVKEDIHDQMQKYQLYLRILQSTLLCLEKASIFSPCDARVYNTRGLAWMDIESEIKANPNTPLRKFAQSFFHDDDARLEEMIQGEIKKNFHLSTTIHVAADQAGCQVGIDADAARLNLGLHYANADNFAMAVEILQEMKKRRIIPTEKNENDADAGKMSQREQEQERILRDADKLCTFCERQLN